VRSLRLDGDEADATRAEMLDRRRGERADADRDERDVGRRAELLVQLGEWCRSPR